MVNVFDTSGSRIGLLGGTFDPVHNGHLAVAAAVKKDFALDDVWFMPAAFPPHKKGHEVSSFTDRTAMLELAVGGRSGFVVSRIEAERPELSYTIDTLRELRRRLGWEVGLFFIIGIDAFLDIATWKAYDKLLTHCSFVVIARPNYRLKTVDEVMRRHFRRHRYYPGRKVWMSEDGGEKIFLLGMQPVAVSSTEIRRLVRTGRAIHDLVPPGVEEYIKERSLYLKG